MRRPLRYPTAQFPEPPRWSGRTYLVSIVLHVLFIVALIWEQTPDPLEGDGVNLPGPDGGGGGGGGPRITFVALSPPPAAAAAVPQVKVPIKLDVPLPVPEVQEITR